MIEEFIILENVFKKYPRPKCVPGWPEEEWQPLLVRQSLSELSEETISKAVFHIFPGHYGNAEIFKYLFPKAIFYSFFLEPDPHTWCPYGYRNGELRMNTCVRCCQWKKDFDAEEISATSELIDRLFYNHYAEYAVISPFYFNLHILWHKSLPDFSLFCAHDLPVIDEFKERLFDVVHSHTAECSRPLLDILFGQTYFAVPIINKDVLYGWYTESIDLEINTYQKLFTKDDIVNLSEGIHKFLYG